MRSTTSDNKQEKSLAPFPHGEIHIGANDVVTTTVDHALGRVATNVALSDMPVGFYEYAGGEAYDLEARRLRTMAVVADGVSLDTIDNLYEEVSGRKPFVVDIGAGDSTSLARSLIDLGINVLSVDSRLDAIATHHQANLPAVHSLAGELPMERGTVDVAHARALWSWLESGNRLQSLAEMLRVGREDMAITVIDFDWSCCNGPELFMQMVESIKGVMRDTGFDPDYGRDLVADFDDKLSRLVEGEHSLAVTRTPVYDGDISGALEMINQTTRAYADRLRGLGITDRADELMANLDILLEYAARNPQAQVYLPEIVSVGVMLKDKNSRLSQAMQLYLDAIDESPNSRFDYTKLEEGIDFERALLDVASAHRIVIAQSEDMRYEARRIKALAYYKKGIVTLDAVDDSGMLVTGNEPIELVERTTYIEAIEDETNWIYGGVGMLKPDPEIGIDSLPEIARMRLYSPLTFASIASLPFMKEPGKVVEVTGFAKNMLGGRLEDIAPTMIVLAELARRQGFDYGVMGLRENLVGMIEGLFGTKAIRRIEGEDAVHQVKLPGVKNKARFVPMYVDGRTFIKEVSIHTGERLDYGPIFEELHAIANEILVSRKKN